MSTAHWSMNWVIFHIHGLKDRENYAQLPNLWNLKIYSVFNLYGRFKFPFLGWKGWTSMHLQGLWKCSLSNSLSIYRGREREREIFPANFNSVYEIISHERVFMASEFEQFSINERQDYCCKIQLHFRRRNLCVVTCIHVHVLTSVDINRCLYT